MALTLGDNLCRFFSERCHGQFGRLDIIDEAEDQTGVSKFRFC